MTSLPVRGAAVLLLVTLIVAALIGAYRFGQSVMDTRWRAKWAEQVAIEAENRAKAEIELRAEELRRQLAANNVRGYAQEHLENAGLDAADADHAGQRLHVAASQLAVLPSCASDSAARERGQAASRAAMVLSDLFQRADKRAGELAKAYDKARIAGLACERSYQSLNATSGQE